MKKERKRKSFIGYVHKGHFQFAGKVFMGFIETLTCAKKKDKFYSHKVRYIIEEL